MHIFVFSGKQETPPDNIQLYCGCLIDILEFSLVALNCWGIGDWGRLGFCT